MGLGLHAVEAIIREHLHRPINGDVLLVGRQTVYYSPRNILRLLSEHAVDVSDADPETIELDKQTIDRRDLRSSDTDYISDRALFRLLKAKRVSALDHSDYEGAEIVHDLREPLPQHLFGITDFLVDGSTLDNVFTPSTVLQNYAKLLRPGGRLVTLNAFSSYDTPYAIMPPLWYLDYFVLNGFADVKVYIVLFPGKGEDNVFCVDVNFLQQAKRSMGRFCGPHHMVTVVMAEKGPTSTTDRLPIQQDYRSREEWGVFLKNLEVIQRSARHHLLRSHSGRRVFDVTGGHTFINAEFKAE